MEGKVDEDPKGVLARDATVGRVLATGGGRIQTERREERRDRGMARKRIGLALSGGVAKGLAHIGVVKGLLELGIPIDCVAGTSSGSLVGALVAAGVPPEKMAELAKRTRWRDLVRPVVPREGLLDSGPMERILRRHLGDRNIEDLALPYAAVAADLETGREVVITSGPVARAVRASCAVPGFFTPVRVDGRLLVDGGVCANIPTHVPRELGADLVIAVDLSGALGKGLSSRNIFGILLRTFEIMQHEKRAIEAKGADVLIRPRVEGLGLVNLDAVDAYIEAGWQAVMAQRDALADLMEKARGRTLLDYINPLNWFGTRTARPGTGAVRRRWAADTERPSAGGTG